jgi:type I phosphodiesterase/nucleotide pyrophosphatase
MPASRKLCLIVVDSLRTDMLLHAVAEDLAPNFAALLERGTLIGDCVSAFPSVTPVACSDIATGVGPDRHHISGMNWYHRTEHRYVEYGSSLEATRAFGLFRTLYDTVYNLNMAHLSHEVETVFERLADDGIRTACTPFLIYRGRRRHELGLEGLMRRVAVAANFRHAVWGPDELFYGELYASRRVPCKPTLARPGTRDAYSACVGRELLADEGYDFLLFSLPDNDHHTHAYGVSAMRDSIAHADHSFGQIVDASGGIDAFCDAHAVILVADHAQTDVEAAVPIAAALGERWRVLEPNAESPELAELAVSPTARAAGIYLLREGDRRQRDLRSVWEAVGELEGVDFVARLSPADGDGDEAVVDNGRGQLRFRPGSQIADWRDVAWDLEGTLDVLGLEHRDGRLASDSYPDGLTRLWSALKAPHAGDILVSLSVGYECVDWGGAGHVGGASHGALLAGDSLGPLVLTGLEPGTEDSRRQWTVRDVAELVMSHFGGDRGPRERAGPRAWQAGAMSQAEQTREAAAPELPSQAASVTAMMPFNPVDDKLWTLGSDRG